VARTRLSSLRSDPRCARSLPLGVRSDPTRPKEWAAGGADPARPSLGPESPLISFASPLGVTPSLAVLARPS
jgi:hypothetical protein